MIRIASGACRRFTATALAAFASVVLASCGSGGVSNDNATGAGTGPLAISPTTATLYSELPTKFFLSGGSGSYLVASSNQSVVSVVSNVAINTFTVIPANVGSDTPVTITVRDANDASAAPATATLTVKPRTITNVVTITPSGSQSAACGTAICSGGDAEVTVVLSQAGVPLADRNVQFDVVSGDVRIITSPPGAPEVDSLSGIATTDGSGIARIRVRALATAGSQTAQLRITDLVSGFSQTASVTISALSNVPLSAQPTTIAFTGPNTNACASGGPAAEVIVSGGTPPYNVSQPAAFDVTPRVLGTSGSRFTVTPTGQCTTGSSIAVIDSNGASVTVTASNAVGTTTFPPFVVAPTDVTFTDCGQQAGVALAGGSGRYFSNERSGILDVGVSGNVGTISLPAPASPSATKPFVVPRDIDVGFSDGQTAQTVTVHIVGNASC